MAVRCITGLRYFIGKWQFYTVFLVFGLIVTAVGGLLVVGGMISTQPIAYDPSYQGFGIYSNSTVTDAYTDIVLTTTPATLYFQHVYTIFENGTYNFAFWFPFHVTSTISQSEEMVVNPTSSGTVIVVKKNATIGQGIASQEVFSGSFNIDETFLSGNKGSFAVVIPFGGFSQTLEKTANELGIHSFTQGKVTFSMDIPYQNDVSSEYPPLSSGIIQWANDLSSNQTVSRLSWNFDKLRETVIVKYEQTFLIELSEKSIFFGGMIFGIGSSITVTVIYDWTKDWWQRKKACDD